MADSKDEGEAGDVVTASGNISEDLPVVRQMMQQIGDPDIHFGRTPWWGKPASEESLDALSAEFGELPQDVIDFYRVTDIASFTVFDDILKPSELLGADEAVMPYSKAIQRDYPEPFENNRPQGHGLLPMSTSINGALLIELGGPDHGRAIRPLVGDDDYFRTHGWSLSDVIACTRELFEFGWYQDNGPERSYKKTPVDDELLTTVRPILDKWNCSPLVAGFWTPYAYEPHRPTNR